MEQKSNHKYTPSKKLTKADGTIAYVFDNKLHNWEGPAIEPIEKDSEHSKEYFEEMTPIFKNTTVNYEDMGEYMTEYHKQNNITLLNQKN